MAFLPAVISYTFRGGLWLINLRQDLLKDVGVLFGLHFDPVLMKNTLPLNVLLHKLRDDIELGRLEIATLVRHDYNPAK